MRSPDVMLTASMSFSLSNAPVTRRYTRSLSAWITPAGRSTFCACNAETIAP